MATLIGVAEEEFSTDLAILDASQEKGKGAMAGGFVGSGPGAASVLCGTKYAEIRVRAERWDGRPPHQPGWEDIDEWPFEEVPDGGPLTLSGFDPGKAALDIEGLGRSRVLVYARGRQRYGYSSSPVETRAPEEWLFQLFPDPDHLDALASGPRRLSGGAPFTPSEQTGWNAAMHAWKQTGWHHYLYTCPGYYETNLALEVLGKPATPAEIAATGLRFRTPYVHPLDDPLAVHLQPPIPVEKHDNAALMKGAAEQTELRRSLAALAGMDDMTTMADFIQALQNVGLLFELPGASRVLVPNAVPRMVWDFADLSEGQRASCRLQIGYADYRHVADDIANLVAWAPNHHLTATPRQLGIRLAIDPRKILGGLDLLTMTHGLAPHPYPHDVPHDELLDRPLDVHRWTREV